MLSVRSSECSGVPRGASPTRRLAVSTKLAAIEAVTTARNPTPTTMTTEPIRRPSLLVGTKSPYPTVVTVCSAHQTETP